MSIFSSLRKSRQQAKEHNAKLAEQKKKEEAQIPYKHVPTHAATDAFASAPPSWREADRPRIVEQNRRRSAMAASGHHMNMPGVPRVGSSLSRVSYPGEDLTPVIRLPMTYSYTGVSSHNPSARESREMIYPALQEMSYMQASLKGKEVPRSYDSQRISPTSSKSGPSPVDSLDGSSSSQDDLEMKPAKSKRKSAEAVTMTHHLHPSHARRKSDASAHQYTLSSTVKSSHTNAHRDSRPPPSMRGFASIPAIAATLPTNMSGSSSGHFSPQSYTRPSSSNRFSSSDALTLSTRQSSATSLPGLSHGPTKQPASALVTPHASSLEKKEHGLKWLALPEPDVDVHSSPGRAVAGPSFANNGATASAWDFPSTQSEIPSIKVHRLQQPDRARQNDMESHAASPQQHMNRSHASSVAPEHRLVNVFPEMAIPESLGKAGKSNKKLLKGGAGNVSRKNRWSTSKVPALLV
ncbi:hypothetical protein E4U55_002875 [Claviceps digitariae]|nr:hypothetical protein E4U55_002875 [Claviceps digitariae]